MAKRGSRKPEKASTRPPASTRSSWPKDNRPPKRGKAAGAPTKPRQSAPVATSQSGKPTTPSDLSAIASTETPRAPKRGRRSKGKVQEPEQKFERRTLTTKEQQEMALRAVRITVEARRRERALKRETKTERDEIKQLRAQAETLETQADQGYELVPEGDLFADRPDRELQAGASTPSMPATAADIALGAIAKHVVGAITGKGGNGAVDDNEPAPKIDPTKADVVRMAAATSGAVDDIQRATAGEQTGAQS